MLINWRTCDQFYPVSRTAKYQKLPRNEISIVKDGYHPIKMLGARATDLETLGACMQLARTKQLLIGAYHAIAHSPGAEGSAL